MFQIGLALTDQERVASAAIGTAVHILKLVVAGFSWYVVYTQYTRNSVRAKAEGSGLGLKSGSERILAREYGRNIQTKREEKKEKREEKKEKREEKKEKRENSDKKEYKNTSE